jgi:HD-GYP domain-containing protein (c-di-GMP phosphodiesterase class II)
MDKENFNFVQYKRDVNEQLNRINGYVNHHNYTNNTDETRRSGLSEALDHLLRLFIFGQRDEGSIIDQAKDIKDSSAHEVRQQEVGKSLSNNGLFEIIFNNQALVYKLLRARIVLSTANKHIDAKARYNDFCLRFGQFIKFCIDKKIDVKGLDSLIDKDCILKLNSSQKPNESAIPPANGNINRTPNTNYNNDLSRIEHCIAAYKQQEDNQRKESELDEALTHLVYLFVERDGTINLSNEDDKKFIAKTLSEIGLFQIIYDNQKFVKEKVQKFLNQKVECKNADGTRRDTYENFCKEFGRFIIFARDEGKVSVCNLDMLLDGNLAIVLDRKRLPNSITNNQNSLVKSKIKKISTLSNVICAILSIIVSTSITYILFSKNTLNTLFGLPKTWSAFLFSALLTLAAFVVLKLLNESVWYYVEKPNKGDVRDCRSNSQDGHCINKQSCTRKEFIELIKKLPPDNCTFVKFWIKDKCYIEIRYNEGEHKGKFCFYDINKKATLNKPIEFFEADRQIITYQDQNSTLWLLNDDPNYVTQKAILGTYNEDYTKMTYKNVVFHKETKQVMTAPEAFLSKIKHTFCCGSKKVIDRVN